MPELLSESNPIARKEHICNACDFICEYLNQGIFTFKEYREIVKAKRNGWKILKGQKYNRANMVDNGSLYTFKSIPAIHDICCKYDLYDE